MRYHLVFALVWVSCVLTRADPRPHADSSSTTTTDFVTKANEIKTKRSPTTTAQDVPTGGRISSTKKPIIQTNQPTTQRKRPVISTKPPNFTTRSPTTRWPTTIFWTPSPTGCFYEGKWHPPGEISRGFDGRNWCYGVVCERSGGIMHWDDFRCGTTLPTTVPTTFRVTPTTFRRYTTVTPTRGCYRKGVRYPPGSIIENGRNKGWCFKRYCSHTGMKIVQDNWECGQVTTTPPRKGGCYVDGKWYAPGSQISKTKQGDSCYGTYCSYDNRVTTWTDRNCRQVTDRTTNPWTDSPVTTPRYACFYQGKWYPPGKISSGFDGRNWCYGVDCDRTGEITIWDNFRCGTPEPTTRPHPTTRGRPTAVRAHRTVTRNPITGRVRAITTRGRPSTTRVRPRTIRGRPTTARGRPTEHHPATAKVRRTAVPRRPTTTRERSITTRARPTTARGRRPTTFWYHRTTSYRRFTTIPPRAGCYDNGKWYPPGADISKGQDGTWCYGQICSNDGTIIVWDDWNCVTTATVTLTTEKPTLRAREQKSTAQLDNTKVPARKTTHPTTANVRTDIVVDGCYYKGKFYAKEKAQIQVELDGRKCVMTCINHKASWVTRCAQTSIPTTPSFPTTPGGCIYQGKFYPPGAPISRDYSNEGCEIGKKCGENGSIETWEAPCDGRTTTSTTTNDVSPPTTTRTGCYHKGKWYAPGALIYRRYSDEGCESGKRCDDNGFIVGWDAAPPCDKPTTKPLQTGTHTAPPGCFYNGQWNPPGSDISRSSHNGCESGLRCTNTGHIMAWDGVGCFKRKTTTHRPTRPPTTPPGCYYNGQWYALGSDISRSSHNGCKSGLRCANTGHIMAWDGVGCFKRKTTTHRPTEPKTFPPTTQSGCYYNGQWYAPGSAISRSSHNGCESGLRCSNTGHIMAWDSKGCFNPPTYPPIQPSGCFYNGQWYAQGSDISRASNNGCESGLTCAENGQVLAWDGKGCFKHKTTTKLPKTHPTTPSGCYYKGKWYAPGTLIYRRYSDEGCESGRRCDDRGSILAWDAAPPCKWPTTMSTKPTYVNGATGCHYYGKFYKTGETIETSGCLVVFCHELYGVPMTRRMLHCDVTTPYAITTPFGCHHNGRWYPPNSDIERTSHNGCEAGMICDATGMILAWDGVGCFRPLSTVQPPTYDNRPKPTSENLHHRLPKEPETGHPTTSGSGHPTTSETRHPTTSGTGHPTKSGTGQPTRSETRHPTTSGTSHPTTSKIHNPTTSGTSRPTTSETRHPTTSETRHPTKSGTGHTTTLRAGRPSTTGSGHPTKSGTRRPTSEMGCNYEGKLYSRGRDIYRSSDGYGWCFGARCSYDGNVILWDDFDCEDHLTGVAVRIHRHRVPFRGECYYRGRKYRSGSKIFYKSLSGICYQGVCSAGKIRNWKSALCPGIAQRRTAIGRSSSPPSVCRYKGRVYAEDGIVFSRSLYKTLGFGWCVGAKCGKNGRIVTFGPEWGNC